MRIFDENEARYYCSNYSASGGRSQESTNAYCLGISRAPLLREGTPEFSSFRDCALRGVERNLFLAASQYKFAHNLMLAGSAWWAHVTLYYGAYYSARALIGMFGAWMNIPLVIVDVGSGNIGAQELTVHRLPRGKRSAAFGFTNYHGTHQAFWDIFYNGIQQLSPWIKEPEFHIAITPVSNDPAWQIAKRNEINYDSHLAIKLAEEFMGNFQSAQFPNSLPGVMNTQFKITENLVMLAFRYAKDFGIATDALDMLMSPATRNQIIDTFIFGSQSRVSVHPDKKNSIVS